MTNAELFKPYGLTTQQIVFPRYLIICSPLQHSHNSSLNVIASSHRLIPCRRRGSPYKKSICQKKINCLFAFSRWQKREISIWSFYLLLHQYRISQFHRDLKWNIPVSLRSCFICILIEKSNCLVCAQRSVFLSSPRILKREDRKRCGILKGVLRSFGEGCGREEGKMPMKATDPVTQFLHTCFFCFGFQFKGHFFLFFC